MRTVLILLIGIALGLAVGIKGLKNIPSTPTPTPDLTPARERLAHLAEHDLADYHRLRDLEEKYKKADELLGKIYLLLIADLGLRLSVSTEQKLKDSAKGDPSPYEPPPSRYHETASVPAPSPPRNAQAPQPQTTPQSPAPARTSPATTTAHSPGAKPFSSLSYRRQRGCENAPMGWFVSRNERDDYTVGIDSSAGELVGSIQSRRPSGSLVELAQCGRIEPGAIKRVQVTAMVKAEGVFGSARLFLRAEGSSQGVLDDKGTPIRGSFDWKPMSVEINSPSNASAVNFGLLLRGAGRIWIKEVSLQILD
jgi:hypothetical protein